MVDKIACRRALSRSEQLEDNFSSERVVRRIGVRNPSGEELTIVFSPWHGGGQALEFLKNRISRSGSAVLSFDVHQQILEPDVNRVPASFFKAQQITARVAMHLSKENNYKRLHLLGLSLGTVSLALMARALPQFDSATIVVGSSNLALSMWEGDRTVMVRRGLEDQGMTAEQLDGAWEPLAPKNHAECFEGRDVDMHISDRDSIVPSRYQYEFAEHLAAAGANLTVSSTRLGHYAAAAQFCLVG